MTGPPLRPTLGTRGGRPPWTRPVGPVRATGTYSIGVNDSEDVNDDAASAAGQVSVYT